MSWPLEQIKHTGDIASEYLRIFPSIGPHFIHENHRFFWPCWYLRYIVLPFLHEPMLWREVYEFSKVEKKTVENQQNSCKGSQCNRVDPITNPLNSGVTL